MSSVNIIAWLRIYRVALDVIWPVLLIAFIVLAAEIRRERCDRRGRDMWAGMPWWASIGVLFTLRETFDASLYTPRGNRLRYVLFALIALSAALSGGFALLASLAP